MKKGYLSSYVRGIVFKRLSAVETDLQVSHQHEFNGTRELINLFGEAKRNFPTRMLYFGEEEADNLAIAVQLTWYDARENHPTRSEHRLYFPGNDSIDRANAGDLLIIALKPDDSLLAVICKAGSTYESQISWLFGIRPDGAERFSEKLIEDENDVEVDFSTRYILEQLGIEVRERDDTHLDRLIARFGNEFPPTDVFS